MDFCIGDKWKEWEWVERLYNVQYSSMLIVVFSPSSHRDGRNLITGRLLVGRRLEV